MLWACAAAQAAGTGISPGLALVQDVPPGKEVNLAKAGQPITVINDTKVDGTFEAICTSLVGAGLDRWEFGYEDMPPGWCWLKETSAEIKAGQKHDFELIVNVPDKPENYNRRFVVGVLARRNAGGGGGTGISIQICSRIMIETLARDKIEAPGGPLAVVPSEVVFIGGRPGTELQLGARLFNNTSGERRCSAIRLEDFYPPEADETEERKNSRVQKPVRYFGGDVSANRVSGWVEAPADFTVPAGGSADVKLKVKIPADAAPGKTYEEVIFLGDRFSFQAGDLRDIRKLCSLLAAGGEAKQPGKAGAPDDASAPGGAKPAEEKKAPPETPAQAEIRAAVEAKAREVARAQRIWGLLDEEIREQVRRVGKGAAGPAVDPDRLLRETFNKLLDRRDLYESRAFGVVNPSGELKLLLEAKADDLSANDLRRRNRLLLETIYPDLLVRCRAYGASGRVAFVRVSITVKKE